MKDTTLVVAGLLTLAAGTFTFRFVGPVLRERISFPPWAAKLLEAGKAAPAAPFPATPAKGESDDSGN